MKSNQKTQSQKNNSDQNKADLVEITYFTDPLCSWSWGFEPQWRRLLVEYHAKINWRYCMGGLIPSWNNFIDPLNSVSRPVQMGPIWMESSHITGMPLESSIWIHNPPQSSYPACISVKAAGLQSSQAEDLYLRRLREAVMLHQEDISQTKVLLKIAEDVASLLPDEFDAHRFQKDIYSDTALEAFRSDINEVHLKQINRFPTLLFRKHGKTSLIITGYRPYREILSILYKMEVQAAQFSSLEWASIYNKLGAITEREQKEQEESVHTHPSI